MANAYVIHNSELYHYGVKGMKWGHRKKYYNNDGSLNKLGQARQTYKNSKQKAYDSFISDMKKLSQEGRGNDIDAVDKRAIQYEAELKSINDKYKQAKKTKKSTSINNMTVEELHKRDMAKARATTAALVGIYGAVTVASLVAAKRSSKARAEAASLEYAKQYWERVKNNDPLGFNQLLNI